MMNKSMVSNASSIIPCSADSFVIINEENFASLVHKHVKYSHDSLPPIVELTERESSESSQHSS